MFIRRRSLPVIAVLSCLLGLPIIAAKAEEFDDYSERIPSVDARIPMVAVRSGSLAVNSEQAGKDRSEFSTVQISPFWIGKFELRVVAFKYWRKRQALGDNRFRVEKVFEFSEETESLASGYNFPRPNPHDPVVGVNAWTAKRYCHWLGLTTGRFYRLPTEAEWEYACRAGTKTAYRWGNEFAKIDRYAVRSHPTRPVDRVAVAGSKLANPWGIYDMVGNAEEWVSDGFRPTRKYNRREDPIVWPVSDTIDGDLASLKMRMSKRGEDYCVGWSIAKGGSHSQYRCQDPSCFLPTARANAMVESNDRSTLPVSMIRQNSIADLDEQVGRAIGFRLARPLKVPDREIQLWHWGIYFDHDRWIHLTIDSDGSQQ